MISRRETFKMIRIDENNKSEAQIRLMEKLERDKKRLQEQIRKDHRKIEELKKKARGCIGDMFADHLPDFYCFDGEEIREIVDTAMSQKAVRDKISEIRNKSDEVDISGEDGNEIESSSREHHTLASSEEGPTFSHDADNEKESEIEENNEPIGDDNEEESEESDEK